MRDPEAGTSISPTLPLFQGFLSLKSIYEEGLKRAISGSVAWAVPGSIPTVHRGSGPSHCREEGKGEHHTGR